MVSDHPLVHWVARIMTANTPKSPRQPWSIHYCCQIVQPHLVLLLNNYPYGIFLAEHGIKSQTVHFFYPILFLCTNHFFNFLFGMCDFMFPANKHKSHVRP